MSNVSAHRCDYCGEIKHDEYIVGISNVQDMYDQLESYPLVQDPNKTFIHHCTECSERYVVWKAEELSPRHHGERAYQLRFNELYSIFRHKCVKNATAKKKDIQYVSKK